MQSSGFSKESSKNPGIIVVLGPTATGKTETAIRIAEYLQTEVVSFDSVQVYRHMDIGSAKPSFSDLTRVPHHLIDVCNPDELFTAGDFRKLALTAIERLHNQGQWAVLVGGTGFYLQALLKGMYPVTETDPEIKEAVKARFEKDGREKLFEDLGRLDPDYQKAIHINDTYRLLRGFEIWEQFQIRPSQLKNSASDGIRCPVIQIGLDRERGALRKTVQLRSEAMVKAGLLDEAARLKKSYGNVKALQSVGYREALDALEGRLPKNDLVAAITTSTMQLAKRQKTWFKRDRAIRWIEAIPSKTEIESLTKLSLN